MNPNLLKRLKGEPLKFSKLQKIKFEYIFKMHQLRSVQCNLEASSCHVTGYESSQPEEVTVELPWRRPTLLLEEVLGASSLGYNPPKGSVLLWHTS